jgi:hypothetical protein
LRHSKKRWKCGGWRTGSIFFGRVIRGKNRSGVT